MTTQPKTQTKALAVRKNIQTVQQWLEGPGRKAIMAQVPKGTLDANRFWRLALQVINDENLRNCTSESLQNAILEGAALGLDCDGLLGHAYILAFKNKNIKDEKGETMSEATLMIGYKGFGVLAMRSRDLNRLAKPPFAAAVCKNDTFDYDIASGEVYSFKIADQDRGEVVKAFAQAVFESGQKILAVLNRQELDAIMARSPSVRAGMSSPWKTDYAAMAAKTALRQLCHRHIPMTGIAGEAIAAEVYREEVIDITPYTAPSGPKRISEQQKTENTPKTTVSGSPEASQEQGAAATPPGPEKPPENGQNAGSGSVDETPPPEPPESSQIPPVDGDMAQDGYERVSISRKVDRSSGTGKKGKWTRYAAFINGSWYVTFDTNFGELLDDAQRAGKEVLIKAEFNSEYKSYNLTDVQAV